MTRYLLFLLAFGPLGCHFGGNVRNLAVAHQPAGVMTSVQPTVGPNFTAELLATRDTDMVVLRSGQVTLVPYRLVNRATFRDLAISVENGRTPNSADRNALRLVSRFPQGLSPDVETRLLAAHHQAAAATLGP